MLKRKKQKQTRKALSRRQTASRMPQRPNSEKELQKLLDRLPILAFEPELNDLRFETTLMQGLQETEEPEPQLIKKLVTPEFLTNLQERLSQMEPRTTGNMQKNLMVKGVLYTLENSEVPSFINPLIVAIYLRSKADFEGEPLALSQLLKAVEAYETKYMNLIEELLETLKIKEDEVMAGTEGILAEEEAAEEEPFIALPEPCPVEKALMEAYYQTLSDLDEESAERMREDVEVFVEEYITQPVEEWKAPLVDTFLGSWFVENLNPVVEDLISMQNSLEHFFQFLKTQQKIPPDELQTILSLLQNKETYQQRMES